MRYIRKTCFVINILFIINIVIVSANANIFITPKRILINEKMRFSEVQVSSRSDKPKSYIVKLVNYEMNEKGELFKNNNMENSAKKFIRYSPRKITIKPNETRVIRIISKAPNNLEEGGYHTHIELQEVAFQGVKKVKKEVEAPLSFEVHSEYNIAIPIIFSKGKLENKVQLEKVEKKLDNSRVKGSIEIHLKNDSNFTNYNLVKIEYFDSENKSYEIIAPSRIAMYREIKSISRVFNIKAPENVKFKKGGEFVISLLADDLNQIDNVLSYKKLSIQ